MFKTDSRWLPVPICKNIDRPSVFRQQVCFKHLANGGAELILRELRLRNWCISHDRNFEDGQFSVIDVRWVTAFVMEKFGIDYPRKFKTFRIGGVPNTV